MVTTSTTYGSAGPAVGPRSFVAKLRNGDEIARMVTFIFAMTVVLLTVLLVYELWVNSALPRHKFGLNFFTTSVWDPIEEQFGALPFIYGTIVTSALALLIAVPLGIGAAIFLAELGSSAHLRYLAVLHRSARCGAQRYLWGAWRFYRCAAHAHRHLSDDQ